MLLFINHLSWACLTAGTRPADIKPPLQLPLLDPRHFPYAQAIKDNCRWRRASRLKGRVPVMMCGERRNKTRGCDWLSGVPPDVHLCVTTDRGPLCLWRRALTKSRRSASAYFHLGKREWHILIFKPWISCSPCWLFNHSFPLCQTLLFSDWKPLWGWNKRLKPITWACRRLSQAVRYEICMCVCFCKPSIRSYSLEKSWFLEDFSWAFLLVFDRIVEIWDININRDTHKK